MTAAVFGATPAQSIPATQNTAPVFEHNCLFTHDIRRKQKRWQDGFLRFHTFNKRIMVYDIPRNFIGDVHWTGDGMVQDGDELHLDKNGVIVQVAESIGKTETDLTGIRQTKKRTPAANSSSPLRELHQGPAASAGASQGRHRSLKALLGKQQSSVGRAVLPTTSPYQQRQRQHVQYVAEEVHVRKRQRMLDRETSHPKRDTFVARSSPPRSSPSPVLKNPERTVSDVVRQEPARQAPEHDQKEGRALRFATTASKRKMLFCQDTATKTAVANGLDHTASSIDRGNPTAREQVAARLAQIEAKRSSAARALSRGTSQRPNEAGTKSAVRTSGIDERRTHALPQSDLVFIDISSDLPHEDESMIASYLDQNDISPVAVRSPRPIREQTEARHVNLPKNDLQDNDALKPCQQPRQIPRINPKAKKQPTSAVQFSTAAHGTSAVVLSKPFQPPGQPLQQPGPTTKPDLGPWSREAFDLFMWRPPGWNEETWAIEVEN